MSDEKSGAKKKKGLQIEDPFADDREERRKKREEQDSGDAKGLVDYAVRERLKSAPREVADKAMGAIGVDLRDDKVRKPRNFLEEQAQGIATSSKVEVEEQKKIGAVKARKARMAGAASGIPRFMEDAENFARGTAHNVGEFFKENVGSKDAQGRQQRHSNPIEDLWNAQRQDPRLAAAMRAAKGSGLPMAQLLTPLTPPDDTWGQVTAQQAKRYGAPHTVESGQNDILNAVPVGVAAKTGAAVGKAFGKKVVTGAAEGGGIMAGQAAAMHGGRETARTGKGYDAKEVAKTAAKAGATGALLGGTISAVAHSTPKSLGNKASAHARETIVSKKPLERTFQTADQAVKDLREGRLSEPVDRFVKSAYAKADRTKPTTTEGLAPGSAELIQSSKELGQRGAEEGKVFDVALSGKENPELAGEMRSALDIQSRLDEFDRIFMSQEEQRKVAELEAAANGPDESALPPPSKLPTVGQIQDEMAPPVKPEEPVPQPTTMAATAKKEPKPLPGKKEELQAIIDDKKGRTSGERRQAQLKLKEIERNETPDPSEAFKPLAVNKVTTKHAKTVNGKTHFWSKKNEEAVMAQEFDDARIQEKIDEIDQDLQRPGLKPSYIKQIEQERKTFIAEQNRRKDVSAKSNEELEKMVAEGSDEQVARAFEELDKRHKLPSKSQVTRQPPEEAPAPKVETLPQYMEHKSSIVRRREIKRQVQAADATPEQSKRYQRMAEAQADYETKKANLEAAATQVAVNVGFDLPLSKQHAPTPEISEGIKRAQRRLYEIAGEKPPEPHIEVFDATLLDEPKTSDQLIDPSWDHKTQVNRLTELLDEFNAADKARSSARDDIKGKWTVKAAPKAKTHSNGTMTHNVEITAPDGTKTSHDVVVREGAAGKRIDTGAAKDIALKEAQRTSDWAPAEKVPAIKVSTGAGTVLLEYYKRESPYKEPKNAPDTPEYQAAKGDLVRLVQKKGEEGSYVTTADLNTETLGGMLKSIAEKFISDESGSGPAGLPLRPLDPFGDAIVAHWNDVIKPGIESVLREREVRAEVIGDEGRLKKLADNLQLAAGLATDIDRVAFHNRPLADALRVVAARMEMAAQRISKPLETVAAKTEFHEAIQMPSKEVREKSWQHMEPDQVEFVAGINELRSEAAEMISDLWDHYKENGLEKSWESQHLAGLYEQFTGHDIRTGLSKSDPALVKLVDYLQRGTYDALVTSNKRIHFLHVVDALTMGTAVAHPENLARGLAELAANVNGEREFCGSFKGAAAFKEARGAAKPTLYDKYVNRFLEDTVKRYLGEKGLKVARLWEGGWLESQKVAAVRAGILHRVGKEMGYKGNLLGDLSREFKTGERILSDETRLEAYVRMTSHLSDAFGYNPVGFVNRNTVQQFHLGGVLMFQGLRSTQSRLIYKFVREKQWKPLVTFMIMNQAFGGSNAVFAPVQNAIEAAAPETWMQLKGILDLASFAGMAEAAGKKFGVINEKNEQAIAPFLRHISHIQPELVPWLYSDWQGVGNIVIEGGGDILQGKLSAKALTALSAIAGGSNLAGITTPSEIESIFRHLSKGLAGAVSKNEDGKTVGGKNMSVYGKKPLGEQSLGVRKNVPTTAFREMMNHFLPHEDVIDGAYANEMKFGHATRRALQLKGYDEKQIKTGMRHFYKDNRGEGPVELHDYIKFVQNPDLYMDSKDSKPSFENPFR